MTSPQKVVFLFDVDNTLLDNDRVQDDLRNHLEHEFGTETRDRYFAILEDLYANRDLAASVKKIQKFGLSVRGGFIVGFDNDSPGIFERQIEFVQKSRIIAAMVGMLNAPRGSRLYERLEREGRLLKNVSGDNTDFSTNILPKMGYEKLAEGYRKVINAVYSPELYYQRVKAFLREYRPLEKRKRHFDLRYIRSHFSHFGAPLKSMVVLGIKDKARLYYWKLLLWTTDKDGIVPALLAAEITAMVRGASVRDGRHLQDLCGELPGTGSSAPYPGGGADNRQRCLGYGALSSRRCRPKQIRGTDYEETCQ